MTRTSGLLATNASMSGHIGAWGRVPTGDTLPRSECVWLTRACSYVMTSSVLPWSWRAGKDR